MKKETCISLLKLLKEHNLEIEQNIILLENLLNLPQNIAEEILKVTDVDKIKDILCYLNVLYVTGKFNNSNALTGIRIIVDCKEEYKAAFCRDLLCNESAIKAGVAIEGAKIIIDCKEEYQVEHCANVLCNESAIEAGIAIEGAKIIANCNEEYQAVYCADALCDKDAIEAGIAIEGVKIIANCKEEYQVVYGVNVLCDKDAIEAGIAIEGVKIIADCKEEYKARYCMGVLCNESAIKAGIAIMGARIIVDCNEEYQADYCTKLLCNSDGSIKAGFVIIKGAKMIANTQDKLCAYTMKELYMNVNLEYLKKHSLDIYDITLFIENAKTEKEMNSILDIAQGRFSDLTTGPIELLKEATGYTLVKCDNINNLSIEDTLFMINEEQFSFPEEINGETVKQFIKQNHGQKYLFKSED